MTRRMQGNSKVPSYSYHIIEHMENRYCRASGCRLVGEETREEVTPPVDTGPPEPEVLVPASGIVLVVNGVVHDAVNSVIRVDHQHARTTYTLIVEKPKPNFFEEGRTYRRFTKWSYRAEEVNATEYFTCTVVEQDGEGELVAFGRLAVEKPHRHDVNRWYLLHQYEWKNEGWEEVNVGKG